MNRFQSRAVGINYIISKIQGQLSLEDVTIHYIRQRPLLAHFIFKRIR